MTGPRRRFRPSRTTAGALAVVILGWLHGCASSPAPMTPTPDAGSKPSRVDPQLVALHEAYEASRVSGASFPPSGLRARIVDDRVVIDAVAEGDVQALQADLVALGMQRPAAFGRTVSGEFPIGAIPALNTLGSLRFAVAASAILRRDPARPP